MPDGNTRRKIGDGTKKFSELPYDDANMTKDAVINALGFTPIGADQVPVKKVNGETGDVKSTYFVTITPTGSGHNATADKTAMEVYAAHEAGYAVYACVELEDVPFKLPLVAVAIANGVPILGFGALGSIKANKAPQYPTVAYNGFSWLAWIGTLVSTSGIDDSLSDSSVNPVQNKAVKAALDNKASIDSPTFTSKIALKAGNGEKVECVNAYYTNEKGETFAGIQLSSQKGNSAGLVAIRGIETPDPNADGSADTAVSVAYLNEQLLLKANNTIVDKDKAGLMSVSDKIKLDGIATEANKTIVDTALSNSSTNPVQNKVITVALANKAGVAEATSKAKGLMSALDKAKMDSLDYGATKIVVDSKLSSGSKNPVENYIIKAALDNLENSKLSKSGGTLTGNVNGKYFCGTWLQSTEASDLGHTPSRIAVLDDSGWIYYRTPAEILNDIGGASKLYVDSAIAQKINSTY